MGKDRVNVEEKQQIALLAATGKSQRAIARAIGRDNKTVAKVLKDPGVMAAKANIEERLADKFEQLTEAILDSVSEDDLLKASLQQKSISAATCLDKSRLLRGASTEIIDLSIKGILANIQASGVRGPDHLRDIEDAQAVKKAEAEETDPESK